MMYRHANIVRRLHRSVAITPMVVYTALLLLSGCALSQRDTAEYVARGRTASDALTLRADSTGSLPDPAVESLKVVLGDRWVPTSPAQFKSAWHFPPVCQNLTGACWSFSGTSFLESEIKRKTGREIRLSEMYFIYWETVEKARLSIQRRGESRFSRGGQANAVLRIAEKYGAVPLDAYGAIDREAAVYQDAEMFRIMSARLDEARQSGNWNEDEIIADIKHAMNDMMGAPPEQVLAGGEVLNPREFFQRKCQIDPAEYVDVMSLMQFPWYEESVYPVADNWWDAPYLNVPLEDFLSIFRTAARDGYTIVFAGDISGPGYLTRNDVALIPAFDIPSASIHDAARQLRFDEGSSTDDHAVQMVGSLEHNGERWYLIKDSYPSARDGNVPGYMFYSEDYVALKALNISVHQDVVERALRDTP